MRVPNGLPRTGANAGLYSTDARLHPRDSRPCGSRVSVRADVDSVRGCVRFIHDAGGRRAGSSDASASLATAEDRWLPLKIGDRAQPAGAGARHPLSSGKVPRARHAAGSLADGRGARGVRPRRAISGAWRGRIRYGFDAPIPYGSGDAFTRFNGRFPISPLANMNVSAAGIEAQHSLADAIAERAVARGRIALSRGVAVLRIAHDRRHLHPERVSDIRRKGTTSPIFSRRSRRRAPRHARR